MRSASAGVAARPEMTVRREMVMRASSKLKQNVAAPPRSGDGAATRKMQDKRARSGRPLQLAAGLFHRPRRSGARHQLLYRKHVVRIALRRMRFADEHR